MDKIPRFDLYSRSNPSAPIKSLPGRKKSYAYVRSRINSNWHKNATNYHDSSYNYQTETDYHESTHSNCEFRLLPEPKLQEIETDNSCYTENKESRNSSCFSSDTAYENMEDASMQSSIEKINSYRSTGSMQYARRAFNLLEMAMTAPNLNREYWEPILPYIDCLTAEYFVCKIPSQPREARHLLEKVLEKESASRFHHYASFVLLACDFFQHCECEKAIEAGGDEEAVQNFLKELRNLLLKIEHYELNTSEPFHDWFKHWKMIQGDLSVCHPSNDKASVIESATFRLENIDRFLAVNQPYRLLEVHQNATNEEINSSWRKKSLLFHPDKTTNPELINQWHLITQARKIINNRRKGLMDDARSSVSSDDYTYYYKSDYGDEKDPKPRFNLSSKIERGPIKPLPGHKKKYPHVSCRVDCHWKK